MTADPRPLVESPISVLGESGITSVTEFARRVTGWVGLPEPRLERLGMNAVYTAGPAVVRIGLATVDPVVAVDLADRLVSEGFEVPAPFTRSSFRHDVMNRTVWATVWTRVHPDPGTRPDWRHIGALTDRLHRLEPRSVADIHPLPRAADFGWWDLGPILTGFAEGGVDFVSTGELQRLVDEWSELGPTLRRARESDGLVVCHGDLHPGNVVVDSITGRTVLLDWDLVSLAPTGWDHAPLVGWAPRWGDDHRAYDEFASGYGTDLRDDRDTASLARLRLLVATVMRIRAAMIDPGAVPEVRNRLRYWTEGESAPPWNAA